MRRLASMGTLDVWYARASIAEMKRTLLLRVRSALAEAGDPRVAKGAQAYMKSEMPYHGVTVPKMRKLA